MKDYLLYLLVRLISLFFNALPLGFALGIARVFGRLAYFANKKRRRIAYANLKASLGGQIPPLKIKCIIKGVYMNLAQSFIELMRFPKVNKEYVAKYIRIENRQVLDNVLKKGKGVIFLTAHFGNWELMALAGAVEIEGHSVFVLAREQKLTRLNSLLNTYRQFHGARIVPKGLSVRALFKNLKKNNLVGILSDQDAGKTGIFVNFFGRLASTPRGAFELANKLDSAVIPIFMARQAGPYHRIFIEKPIEPQKDIDIDSLNHKGLQDFAEILEGYIRKYPSQWLWLHKRWKSSPDRSVVVLDDGKPGHLNQSLAVLKQLERAHRDKFKSRGTLRVDILRVEFRSNFKKFIFKSLVRFFLPYLQGNLRFLKFALEEDSFLRFSEMYADIIISCGSSLEAVNLALKRENNAKSAVIMKPSFMPISKFDMAVVPYHDRSGSTSNVIKIPISPNLVDEEYLRTNSKKLLKQIKLNKPFKIGVFLGGDSKRSYLSAPLIKLIMQQLKEASIKMDAELLITTSRRTPTEIEKMLEENIRDFSNCGLLIIANKVNPPETVGGILGLSHMIVTSSDSISMVSEAVSTGKPVIVFEAERKNTFARYKEGIMLQELLNKGLISISKPSELSNAITALSLKAPLAKPAEQLGGIYEFILRRLF